MLPLAPSLCYGTRLPSFINWALQPGEIFFSFTLTRPPKHFQHGHGLHHHHPFFSAPSASWQHPPTAALVTTCTVQLTPYLRHAAPFASHPNSSGPNPDQIYLPPRLLLNSVSDALRSTVLKHLRIALSVLPLPTVTRSELLLELVQRYYRAQCLASDYGRQSCVSSSRTSFRRPQSRTPSFSRQFRIGAHFPVSGRQISIAQKARSPNYTHLFSAPRRLFLLPYVRCAPTVPALRRLLRPNSEFLEPFPPDANPSALLPGSLQDLQLPSSRHA